MDIPPTTIAESFSRHDFASVYAYVAENVVWHNVGGDDYTGRDAILAACDAAGAYFSSIKRAEVELRRTTVAEDLVIVEAIGTYDDGEDTSRVASCDLYEFHDGRLTAITSYNVEVEPGLRPPRERAPA